MRIDPERYRMLALRSTSEEVVSLSPFDRTMVRATEWLFHSLVILAVDSDEDKQAELKTYITDMSMQGIMVDRCITWLYKALYVYIYHDECGLEDRHMEWLSYAVICAVMSHYKMDFDQKALPKDAALLARDLHHRIQLYEVIIKEGLDVVKSRAQRLAIDNHQRVQQKALFRL